MPVYPTRPTQRKEDDRHRPEVESGKTSSMLTPHRADDPSADSVADGDAGQDGADAQEIHRAPPRCLLSAQAGTISDSRVVPCCIAHLPLHGPLSLWSRAHLAHNFTYYSIKIGSRKSSGKRVQLNSVPPPSFPQTNSSFPRRRESIPVSIVYTARQMPLTRTSTRVRYKQMHLSYIRCSV